MRRVFCILLAALKLSIPTYAVTVIVPDGEIEVDTITLADDGDVAIIEEGGAVAVNGVNGIEMNNINQSVFNQGRIFVLGVGSFGILNNNNGNSLIINEGLISSIDDAINSSVVGNNVVIINNGQISTFGNSGVGIVSNQTGDNTVITNNGQISTAGNSSFGISTLVTGDNVVVTNSGLISTLGSSSLGMGITVFGSNVAITNSGLISTVGNSADGLLVDVTGSNLVITNSGLITTEGVVSDAIQADNDNVQIINSGTLRSAQSFAILISGADPTLTLLRGSNIQGPVVSSDDPLNLNVETGLNLALTLDGGSTFGALGIEAPFALVGNDLIAVIDPTGLAMQADVAADLSDTILGAIYLHRIGFPCCIPCGCGMWVQGIGSSRKRSRDKDFVGYNNWQGGFLVGYDTPLWGGNGGLFGGISFGEAEVDQETQRADTTSYVGGITYEWLCRNTFIGAALAVGYVNWDNERFVMYNLAEGGVQKARADTGGGFVTADLTAARHFDALCCTTMSFSLRYAGLFLGSYNEKGSISNLFVKDREVDLITTRFEVSLPWTESRGNCCWSVEPYAGVYGRYQVGGKQVDAVLLGESLSFDPGIPHNLAAFLFGFRGVQS
ncbi:MAG: autotransporter domain-containing protein, partial [Chlamydiales bacterium]